jgi:chromosome segregation ATPase
MKAKGICEKKKKERMKKQRKVEKKKEKKKRWKEFSGRVKALEEALGQVSSEQAGTKRILRDLQAEVSAAYCELDSLKTLAESNAASLDRISSAILLSNDNLQSAGRETAELGQRLGEESKRDNEVLATRSVSIVERIKTLEAKQQMLLDQVKELREILSRMSPLAISGAGQQQQEEEEEEERVEPTVENLERSRFYPRSVQRDVSSLHAGLEEILDAVSTISHKIELLEKELVQSVEASMRFSADLSGIDRKLDNLASRTRSYSEKMELVESKIAGLEKRVHQIDRDNNNIIANARMLHSLDEL